MIKLLHTSDIHLGKKFVSLGEKGKQQREQLKETFARVVTLAVTEKVNFFLITGDLFDSQNPPLETIIFVNGQFKRLEEAGIEVCLIAGTHDQLEPGAVLRRPELIGGRTNVVLFDEGLTRKYYPQWNLTIFGYSLISKTSNNRPLVFLQNEEMDGYNVALLHGSYFIPELVTEDDHLFYPDQVENSRLDYLALGHWHSVKDCSRGKVKAFYPGSPEMLDTGEVDSGNVLLVDLGAADGTRVSIHKVGRRRFQKLKWDWTQLEAGGGLEQKVNSMANPDLILAVDIVGLSDWEENPAIAAVEESMKDRFFYLTLNNHLQMRWDQIEETAFPENLVIGQFVRLMKEKIREANDDYEQGLAEEVLQYGIALLRGKEVW